MTGRKGKLPPSWSPYIARPPGAGPRAAVIGRASLCPPSTRPRCSIRSSAAGHVSGCRSFRGREFQFSRRSVGNGGLAAVGMNAMRWRLVRGRDGCGCRALQKLTCLRPKMMHKQHVAAHRLRLGGPKQTRPSPADSQSADQWRAFLPNEARRAPAAGEGGISAVMVHSVSRRPPAGGYLVRLLG
jgi:hypothetical protein